MASSLEPKIQAYKADGAIVKGTAVKFGTDFKHVTPCAAATDKAIGIAQNDVSTAESTVEVCVEGGCKGLAQTTVTTGALLVSHTDAKLKPIAAAGNRLIAIARQDAVAGDLFDVQIVFGQAQATE